MPENSNISNSNENAVSWLDETIPVATRFNDPYYSKTDGLAETRHVFLAGNRLAERFARCTDTFTIAELGFGTGLNFLAAWQLWRRTAPPNTQLTYLSFERYPMAESDMRHALSRWPELTDGAEKMMAKWNPDFEFFEFHQNNMSATVFFADANIRLPQLSFQADAWFLDGFAPSRNPDLWSLELMQQVFAHTEEGGTFATYTAAGWVRRNLQAAGFGVDRVPGHGTKREMMTGIRQGACDPVNQP